MSEENCCPYCMGHGIVYDWIVNPEDGDVTCPKCFGIEKEKEKDA